MPGIKKLVSDKFSKDLGDIRENLNKLGVQKESMK